MKTRTIFVVENDDALREFLCEVLPMFGYNVIEANCGAAALSIWEQHRDSIDLLLTDVIMPGGVNGFELARKLQTNRPDLKVIFSTGSEIRGIASDFFLSEDVNLLPKPFKMEDLSRIIRHALDNAEGEYRSSSANSCATA